MELWRHVAGVETWSCRGRELWSSGVLEARCRRRDVEVLKYGALEARCRRMDVEV